MFLQGCLFSFWLKPGLFHVFVIPKHRVLADIWNMMKAKCCKTLRFSHFLQSCLVSLWLTFWAFPRSCIDKNWLKLGLFHVFAKLLVQFLANTRCFWAFSRSCIDKTWLKLGLFHVFVLSMVTKSLKTPSFSLNVWHSEHKILNFFRG